MASELKIEARRFGREWKDPFNRLSDRHQKIIQRRALDDMYNVLIDGGLNIRNKAIKRMRKSPADTSKRYRVRKTGTRAQRFHNPSFPGNPPRPVSGGLMGSILIDENVLKQEVRVGSIITDPPYPIFLEEGTDRMKPRPWIGPPYKAEKRIIERDVTKALKKAASDFARGR